MKPQKLSAKVTALLNERLADAYHAYYAYYTYKAASNWCKNVGYEKAAQYFHEKAEDELKHAQILQDFMVMWNVTPALPVISTPELTYSDLVAVINAAYKLEYALYEAYEQASDEIFGTGDICAFDFLQQLRAIQTKSVGEYSDMINMLDGVDTSKFNLLLIEDKLF